MPPVIVPPSTVLPRLFIQVAGPLAAGPVELNLSTTPVLLRKTVSAGPKPHCWQLPGASGAGGNARAGAAPIINPDADAAAAAANSGDAFKNQPFGMSITPSR